MDAELTTRWNKGHRAHLDAVRSWAKAPEGPPPADPRLADWDAVREAIAEGVEGPLPAPGPLAGPGRPMRNLLIQDDLDCFASVGPVGGPVHGARFGPDDLGVNDWVWASATDPSGRWLAIASEEGLRVVDQKTQAVSDLSWPPGMNPTPPARVEVGRGGHQILWVGARDCWWLSDDGSGPLFATGAGLAGAALWRADGKLWIAEDIDPALDDVRWVRVSPRGDVALVDGDAGLRILDVRGGRPGTPRPMAGPRPTVVAFADDGALWMGHESGWLERLWPDGRPGGRRWMGAPITGLDVAKRGRLVYVGTDAGTLHRLEVGRPGPLEVGDLRARETARWCWWADRDAPVRWPA